uniref:Aa_trans domain-containing protein n=1 Tax=Steinernema glaseri TaxID=37863 RepID=A0A1I8AL39_9BILA
MKTIYTLKGLFADAPTRGAITNRSLPSQTFVGNLLQGPDEMTAVPYDLRKSLESVHRSKGIGWFVTALFIVADMAGGGVVAMPVAFLNSGLYAGVGFMIAITIIFGYTAHQLGEVWVIMQKRWPEYHDHCRKPYPEIAARSMGQTPKAVASISVYVTIFGMSIVYLLLSSTIIHHFVANIFGLKMDYCIMVCIIAVVLLPFTYLKSPQDFWGVIVIAMLTTALSVILIVVGITIDKPTCGPAVVMPTPTVTSAVLSLGTFLFAFAGHYVFPTIQHDMKRPKDFTKSCIVGFAIVALLYMPMSIYAYTTYGDSLKDSVINSIQTSWIQETANIFIAVHCILTLTILMNPLNQEAEEIFAVPQEFSFKRIGIRTGIMCLVLFCALSVPEFGPFMNLVGASTIPIVCVIFPSLFNLYIKAANEEQWAKGIIPSFRCVIRRTPLHILIINAFVLLVAVGGGIISTYLAVNEMTNARFAAPCYIRPFLDGPSLAPSASGHAAFGQTCCGHFQNISVYGDNSICNANL